MDRNRRKRGAADLKNGDRQAGYFVARDCEVSLDNCDVNE
jgi:hypothetical protein